MKKYCYLIFIIILLMITGCGKSSNEIEVNYVDYKDKYLSGNYTYRFVGQSEHFYFETGKVYYGDNIRELVITNFKVKDNVSSNSKYSLNLFFNNKLLWGDETGKYNINHLFSKDGFEGIDISEMGKEPERDQNGNIIGEGDSFLETSKDDFKKTIKIEGYYCENDKCEREEFKLKFIDE